MASITVNMIKCDVCGFDFLPDMRKHYVARDDGETGLTTMFQATEGHLYDAYDCPMCGCQKIIQKRKREFHPWNDDSLAEESSEEDEASE